jgi:hypothetical protein
MEIIVQSGEEIRSAKPTRKIIWNDQRPRRAANAVRSLHEVAEMLGLSRQRVHEIEASAIRKLRHAFVREIPSLEFRKDEGGKVCGLTEADCNFPA